MIVARFAPSLEVYEESYEGSAARQAAWGRQPAANPRPAGERMLRSSDERLRAGHRGLSCRGLARTIPWPQGVVECPLRRPRLQFRLWIIFALMALVGCGIV